ncbi:hypothetical protein CL616_00545 [archaeon]|nr:hypothetical protein [archaeon]|tara:strand:- start:17 stop:253 length:237 start_codon:yes stop_codon:yes gene_type:complete
MKLNPIAMAGVFSIFGGFWTLVVGILGQLGFDKLIEICNPFYIFDLSTGLGVVLGAIEALVFWWVMGYLFVWLYNKFI